MGPTYSTGGEDPENWPLTLLKEVIHCYFALRAGHAGSGLNDEIVGGSVELLRTLAAGPPASMAEVARRRGVSRQYIQKLANELKIQGWLALEPDPADKRSRLMRITSPGQDALVQTDQQLKQLAAGWLAELELEQIRIAAQTLARLRAEMAAAGTKVD